MAYTLQQQRYFARELARSGGNIAAAAKALRDEYEDLRNVGESTLRRWMKDSNSNAAEMIAEESARQAQVAAEISAQAERNRLAQELMGSEVDRLARDEAILDDLRNLVKEALAEAIAKKEEAKLPITQISALYERMVRVSDSRRQRTLPAVTTTKHMSLLMKIVGEEMLRSLGAKAKPVMDTIRERYVRDSELLNTEATAAAG